MTTADDRAAGRAGCVTVYQLRADVVCREGMENAYAQVIDLILPFIADSIRAKLPEEALRHGSFEISRGERSCECVAIPGRLLWAVRLRFPREDGTVLRYDISLVREEDSLLFGLKIDAVQGADAGDLREMLPPVGELLASGLLAEGRPLADNFRKVDTDEDVRALVRLLEAPRRTLPVIVVSAVNGRTWSFTPDPPEYMIDAVYLAEHVRGYAIVAQMSFRCSFALTEAVGRNWSVFDGACRTYYPRVDLENGSPHGHPLIFKDRIRYWSYADQHGGRAFTSFLIDAVHRAAAKGRNDWSGLFFVPDARILAAELEMAHAFHVANAPAREAAMRNHIEALKRKLEAAVEESSGWLEELERTTEELESCRQENASLRLRLDALRSHLVRRTGESVDAEVPIPDNYGEMSGWVKEHLAGRLLLHPRAERALSKAEYAEVGMVYRALLILAGEYRDSRMGIGTDEAFRNALARNGMAFSGSIDRSRAGQEGDAYYVRYPVGSSQRVFLQFHLERGNRHEDRYCMRIYFFWDADTSQVVVGWLPSHLDNRMT